MSKLQKLLSELDTSSDNKAHATIAKLVKVGRLAVPPLIEAAGNLRQPRVRKWAIEALGALADQRGAKILVGALSDERMSVRLHALRGLASMKYKRSAKKVAELLADPSGGIRVNALDTLIALRSKSPEILKCLDDAKWYVRQNAARACGELSLTGARTKLKELSLMDKRKAVRTAAAAALANLSPHS
jgi:HEAT repeat protein